MRLQEGYLLKEIAGEYVLFPFGQNVVDYKSIMSVNETGKFIINKLQNDISYDELLQCMVSEYEAEENEEVQILRADMEAFLQMLKALGLLAE